MMKLHYLTSIIIPCLVALAFKKQIIRFIYFILGVEDDDRK